MKFLKLSLMAGLILASVQVQCNPKFNSKHIALAIVQTATKEGACPEALKPIANMFKRGTIKPFEANQALKKLSIADKAFVLKSLIELFFDETNTDSFSTHVEAFIYFNNQIQKGEKLPQVNKFISKLRDIKNSTDSNEIKNTMESEIKAMGNLLKKQYPEVAQRIKHDLEQFFKSKTRSDLARILVKRAKANK